MLGCVTHTPLENLAMNTTLGALTVAALVLFATQTALAQSTTRTEVKKETAEANKAGAIPGSGTGPNANAAPPISAKSEVPRAEVKKETASANKAGMIPGTGTGPSESAAGQTSPKEKAATSTTTRVERKQDTAAANKAGTIPQGEAAMQQQKK
jgi:hypothetical protein